MNSTHIKDKTVTRTAGPNQNDSHRTLCLVDVENMLCTSQVAQAQVARLRDQICCTATLQESDQVVIATDASSYVAAAYGWAGSVTRTFGIGEDGADLALLDFVDDLDWVAKRFTRVVIASGDHIFATAVAALKSLGLEVLVIAPPVGLSKKMKFAAGPDIKSLNLNYKAHVVYGAGKETA